MNRTAFSAVAALLATVAFAMERPAGIEPLPTFDPVKAGWPLVFSDEFDGDSLDLTKWEPCVYYLTGLRNVKVSDGQLTIAVNHAKGGKKLEAAAIWTKEKFLYGYFEARVKFTRKNGWWSAFWLYGDSVGNPFVDGFEIDIFEDYYTRRLDAQGNNLPLIDYNLHMRANTTPKSWNYIQRIRNGTLDDYHVIACRWTPFEISYYMDGELVESKAKHSPWKSITFDAFNHGNGITPLHAVLSGQVMSEVTWLEKAVTDYSDCTFPEYFHVDYVRVYGMPYAAEDLPCAKWAKDYPSGKYSTVKEGERKTYSVNAAPAAKTGSPVKTVYLFDSGFLLEKRTEPPYDFTVECSQEYYGKTDFMRPGRQKRKPPLIGEHALVAYVEDMDGRISHTDAIQFMVVSETVRSRPFQGVAAKIPGDVDPARFDEGGQGVAYFDGSKGNRLGAKLNWRTDENVDCEPGLVVDVRRWEWLNYTVDIAEAGSYEVSFRYGTPYQVAQYVDFLVDLKPIGRAELKWQDLKYGWECRNTAKATLNLPAGRHVLRLAMFGGFDFRTLTFRRID